MNSKREAEKLALPGELVRTLEYGPINSGIASSTPWIHLLDEQEKNMTLHMHTSRYKERQSLVAKLQGLRNGVAIVYHSRNMLTDSEVTALTQFLNGIDRLDNLDLILNSHGGLVSSAYKLGEILHEYCNNLRIIVSQSAKSAATVIALAGNELTMGPSSELGPIDPQIQIPGQNRFIPALAIKDFMTFIEGKLQSEPSSFHLYQNLLSTLDPLLVGHFLREIESAKQYAQEFLAKYSHKGRESEQIAESLTTKFNSHGYCINRRKARELGLNVVDASKEEWTALTELYHLCERELDTFPNKGGLIIVEGFEYAINR